MKVSGTVVVTDDGRTTCCSRPGRLHGFPSFSPSKRPRRLSVFVELNRCAVVGRRASAGGFAKHFDRCPEQLGSEDIRSYQLHLIHQKASWSRFNQVVCALRSLYATTLCRSEQMPLIPYGKKPKSLPCVLSTEEVASLLTAARYRPAPPPPRLQRAESSKFTHSICRRGKVRLANTGNGLC